MNNVKVAFSIDVFLCIAFFFPILISAQDKMSFSGKVTTNVGCLEIIPAPIQNAKVKIYPDISCMINAVSKKSVSSSSGIDSTLTDASGKYHFENLDPDNFDCSSIIAEVEADGYFKQRKYIFPKKDSLLYFSLIKESSDSIYRVFAAVYAIDTTAHFSPQPLGNYRIEVADPLLSWLSRVKDTTDVNGKAEFTLSAVPKVDYLISAKPLSGSSYRGEIITNISACMGNDAKINILIPRTNINQKFSCDDGAVSIECIQTSFNSRMITMKVISSTFEKQERRIFMRLYNLKGTLIRYCGEGAIHSISSRRISYEWKMNGIPGGVYLFTMDMGKKAFSQKLFLPK
jgi:hypothetical protein